MEIEIKLNEKQYSSVVKPTDLGQAPWIWIPALPLNGRDLGESYLSPQCLSLFTCQMDINNVLKVIHKILEKLLASSKCLLNIIYFFIIEAIFLYILIFKEILKLFLK